MDHNDKSKLPFPFNFPPEPSSSFPLASVDNSVNFPFFSQFQFDSPAENGGAKPLYCFQGNVVPPFLSKTYDIVDDPSLDPIISWGERGDSFIVWETADFSTIVLPRYFKHANFSSFVRQLNTYGFRKIEADKWEFANEFFLQGSKHLLKNIQRRRPRQHHQISGGESSGLVEMEKSVMMQEMEEMHQQNRETAARIESIKKRLQASEQRQKQMFSFVAKTVRCLPGCIPKTRRKIVKKKTQEQGDDEQIEFKPELHYPEFQDSLHHSVNIQVGSAGVSDYGDGEFSAIQNRYLVDYSLDGFSDAWDLSPIQEEGRLEVEKRQYD